VSGAASGMMRAAQVIAPGRVEVVEVPRPAPAPGEVRVRLEGCGVCASNLPPWEGRPWFTYPMEPGALGHEGWGVVDALGAGVTGFAEGDRVALLSQHAYAEYDVAPVTAVVPLPPTLGGVPVPAEPLGCALNIARRSEIQAGETVAIIGVGFLGALLVRLACEAGARVLAINRRRTGLEIARDAGAHEVIPMEDHHEIIARVSELTGGQFCECVIECVGKQWPLDLAAEITRERGRLIVAGYHQDGPRQVNMQLWNWRGLDVINAHERDPAVYYAGMEAAVAALTHGKLNPTPLYTHTFPLERLADALNITGERPDGFVKALVVHA
jgi:Threonine dehydrogenase and related Zn-dependent dehydrogenases